MSTSRTNAQVLLAPGAASHTAWAPPHDRLPPLDERLVTPEGREERIAGRSVYAAPANPEHGDTHSLIDMVITSNAKHGYVASTDMLTRSSIDDDFASDTSVRRAGIDPVTKQRYLEELAFEIANTQSLTDVTDKATAMSARGVRRVFAVFVRKGEVHEWVAGAWVLLADDAEIADDVLAAPVKVRALLDAAAASASAVRGLLARREPELTRTIAEAEQRGEQRGARLGDLAGRRAMLWRAFEARGLVAAPAQRAQVDACEDAAQMEQWLLRAIAATTTDDVFA